ncbi:hypothetical protein NLU13_1354 [Sarocladium strictum]|uniref:Acetyl-CoA synthetase-like protein n=1 Tax=Sarocladium strictum TaxID=5046 RepID=A0AA39GQT6_SARSR|nr:hypothetical protein NLU13_1354 [Sarocladium strictum]
MSSSAASPAASLPRLPIFDAISRHDPTSTAVIHSLSGRSFQYGELLGDVRRARDSFLGATGQKDLNGQRIAFLVENSYDYVVTLLAALACRSIAVPLSPAFPTPELQYVIDHSEASLLVLSTKFLTRADDVLSSGLAVIPKRLELGKHQGGADHEVVSLEGEDAGEAGMMLYTSGTTNRPKGVLLPESVMMAQSTSLQIAWEYSSSDHLLHVLPLHHIHGIINAIITPLLAGSTIEFLFPFNPSAVWSRLASPYLPSPTTSKKITFFTAVPTVYSRLLKTHKDLPADVQAPARDAISPSNMRLTISGSAALPTPTKLAWRDLSQGSILLERYGMTEVGMALSCGLSPADRVDASVGWPLPSVEARLVDTDTNTIIDPSETDRQGEIQLRGPTIFREYWRNPAATSAEFTPADPDDLNTAPWFRTGDVALRRPVPSAGLSSAPSQTSWAHGPLFFIQGRKSADIIKTGGEKVSALEVERELLSIPQISEAAVVAVPSGQWGHKVGAVVVLNAEEFKKEGKPVKWTRMDMRRALQGSLAKYKIPQVLKVVDGIPRNAMGKINKKQLVKVVFADEHSADEM